MIKISRLLGCAQLTRTRAVTMAVVLPWLTVGCGEQPQAIAQRSGGGPETTQRGVNPSASGAEQRRADLLNRIRAADPQQATIQRALINENNELGLVLSPQAKPEDIPKLMKPLLSEMDKAFPGEGHTIVAYAPTNPPRRVGTARLDPRTREMTYTKESP